MELPRIRQHGIPGTGPAECDQTGSRGLRIEPLTGRTGLKVVGEIDLSARDDWETFLESMVATRSDVYLDLSATTARPTPPRSAVCCAATSAARPVPRDHPVIATRC
jgi:hypothetical protein